MHPDQIKHLELLQAVITRMASNSFVLKGWAITLSAAVLVLAGSGTGNFRYAWLGLVVPPIFWALDAYYLRQERLFRKLYDHVRRMTPEEWSTQSRFSMATGEVASQVPGWFSTLGVPAVAGVYLALLFLASGMLMIHRG